MLRVEGQFGRVCIALARGQGTVNEIIIIIIIIVILTVSKPGMKLVMKTFRNKD